MIDKTAKMLLQFIRFSTGLFVAAICCCGNSFILLNLAYSSCPPPIRNALYFSSAKIVFVSDRDGNNELYMMNADGTKPINLTHNPADDRSPALSPDGKQIAFVSNRTGNYQIYVMNLDGTDLKNISNIRENDGKPDLEPVHMPPLKWTTDENTIVFASGSKPSNYPDSDSYLYSIQPDGTGRKRLQHVRAVVREYSPNKHYVAYFDEDKESLRTNGETLWVTNADGSNRRRVVGDKEFVPLVVGFSWSPDGRKLAYPANGFMEIQDIETGAIQSSQQFVGVLAAPRWSSDGQYLLFAYIALLDKDSREEGYWRSRVYVLDTSTSQSCLVSPYAKFDDDEPIWVPGQ